MSNKKPQKRVNESNAKCVNETNSVDDALNFFLGGSKQTISEEETNKAAKSLSAIHKESGKQNADHIKASEKNIELKIDETDEDVNVKYRNNEKSQKIHDELETLNGMEMVEYDIEPSDDFKERAKNAMFGKSPNGDVPANAIDSDFSDNFEKRIKASKKDRDASKLNYVAMGNDMEILPDTNRMKKGKSLAFEGCTHFAVNGNKVIGGYKLNDTNLNEEIKNVVIPDLRSKYEGINLKETKIHNLAGLGRLGIELNEGIGADYANDTLFAFYVTKDEKFDFLYMTLLGSWDFDLKEYSDYSRKELAEITYPDMADWYPDLEGTIPGLKIRKGNFRLMTVKEVEKANLDVSFENTFTEKLKRYQPENGVVNESVTVLKFKQRFTSTRQAMSLIPNSLKVEGKRFKMTDGDTKYLIEWKGNAFVGQPSILEEKNPRIVAENLSKIKHLMAYNSINETKCMTNKQIKVEEDVFKLTVESRLRDMREKKEKAEQKLIKENKTKVRKEKFKVRNVNFNDITKRYAKVKDANYIKEGSEYTGVNYNILISEASIPKKEIMEQIRRDNLNIVPGGRKIVFTFLDKEGNVI